MVSLFASGSCSGYLKSDGTCSTPSGAGVDRQWVPQANGLQCSSPLTIPVTNGPTMDTPVVGTNTIYCTWPFTAGVAGYLYGQLAIPTSVPSTLTAELWWRTVDTNTGHTTGFEVDAACSATTGDPSLSITGTSSQNVVSSSYQWTQASISLTLSGCSAGNELFFKLTHHGDTDTVCSGVGSCDLEVSSVRIHN